MFGGDGRNTVFSVTPEENHFKFEANSLPQLQLFGNFPIGCTIEPLNYMRKEHTNAVNRPVKREADSLYMQQKLHMSLNNNFHQDEIGIMNPNHVSTGLRLSNDKSEPNSSVTTPSENFTGALPVISAIGNSNLKIEMDRQMEELDQYIQLQEKNLIDGVKQLKQKHAVSFLSAIEKSVCAKLYEKEMELESLSRKNQELSDRVNQFSMEAQTWHYRAKHNELVVNALQKSLKQVIKKGVLHGKESYGNSEVEDTASYTNPNRELGYGNSEAKCRSCMGSEVCVLLLPCRHLCVCKDCEGFVDVCPVCRAVKTASVRVYMS